MFHYWHDWRNIGLHTLAKTSGKHRKTFLLISIGKKSKENLACTPNERKKGSKKAEREKHKPKMKKIKQKYLYENKYK